MAYAEATYCRICGNPSLEPVLDLGDQVLTGVFPERVDDPVTRGPLRLVKCMPTASQRNVCGLLQLQHSYDLDEMYGDNYGYRSGLNQSMVDHLQRKVDRILDTVSLEPGDLVIDIGSNDGTTLSAYPHGEQTLVGIDPTGVKFWEFYPSHVQLIADFFSAALITDRFPGRQAKVVTSFSMFYDLETPLAFMREIYDVLSDDGLWVFEQSYLPTMLARNSYDTACHEHLEYYALHQIKWMTDQAGFTITDLEFNDVNGGSFSVSARKSLSGFVQSPLVNETLEEERRLGLDTLEPYRDFAHRVARTKRELRDCITAIHTRGETVHALGASTKGNVLLQYCGFTAADIQAVGEVNSEKFGHFTPGTHIPIVPEDTLLATRPNYLLILPWHFRDFFAASPRLSGQKLIFPLPNVEIVEVP